MITQTPIMKDGNRRSNQNIMIVQCANNARAFASPKLIDWSIQFFITPLHHFPLHPEEDTTPLFRIPPPCLVALLTMIHYGIIWRSMAGQAWWLLNEWIGWWRRIDEWWNDYWSWSMEMTWRFERGRNKIVKEISVFHDAHCICAQRCFVLRLLWYHPFLRTACSLFCAYIRATIRNNDSLSTRFNNGL